MIEAYKNEEYKVEVINGLEIVMMSPAFSNHNLVKGNIHYIFQSFLRNSTCIPVPDGQKLVLNDDSYVIPDFFVVCDRDKFRKDGVYGTPNLIVEVLSDSSMKYDRGAKKDLYQSSGVKEYWLVEPDSKFIEVYLLRNDVYVLDEIYRFPNELEDIKEQALAITKFNPVTFPETTIELDEVFCNVFDW